jgi:hypothetical protein
LAAVDSGFRSIITHSSKHFESLVPGSVRKSALGFAVKGQRQREGLFHQHGHESIETRIDHRVVAESKLLSRSIESPAKMKMDAGAIGRIVKTFSNEHEIIS